MRDVGPPLPSPEDRADRAVLRDGSVVQLRLSVASDRDELARFFHHLSFESLRRRFFGPAEPSPELLGTFCSSTGMPTSSSTGFAGCRY